MTDSSNHGAASSAPAAFGGRHALYGPPRWHFEGYAARVVACCDPAILAPYLPAPLQIDDAGIVHLSALDLVSDCGLGPNFVLENPDLSQVKEAVIGVMARHNGEPAYWPLYLWTDNDAEIAVGREMYGWQQRRGEISISRQPFRGWQAGDPVVVRTLRGNRSVFEFRIALDRPVEPAAKTATGEPAGAQDSHIGRLYIFTDATLVHPVSGSRTRRLVRTGIEDVNISDEWEGTSALRIYAPELEFLRDATLLNGRWHKISWTKPAATDVVREVIAQRDSTTCGESRNLRAAGPETR